MRRRTAAVTVAASALLGAAGPAQAAGFAVLEQDAAGLGRAYAGAAARRTPAALGVNPAALPDAASVSASLHGLDNQLKPHDAASDALIPALYAAGNGFGAGLSVPFGLATDYPAGWRGQARALHSEITAARATIAGSAAIAPGLRLGAGVFVQRLDAQLSEAITLAPRITHAVQVSGSATDPGFSLGALWQPSPILAVGLGYGSPVWHDLKGRATLPGAQPRSRVRLTTPETVAAGLVLRVRPALDLLAGATWTRWSRLASLDIRLANGATLRERHD